MSPLGCFHPSQTDLGLYKHFRLSALSPSHTGSCKLPQRKKWDIVECHPAPLTDDFLCHYVMEFRASPAPVRPVASVHTPGYERTGNWSIGCWVTTLGIYNNTSGGVEGTGVGGVHMYST